MTGDNCGEVCSTHGCIGAQDCITMTEREKAERELGISRTPPPPPMWTAKELTEAKINVAFYTALAVIFCGALFVFYKALLLVEKAIDFFGK